MRYFFIVLGIVFSVAFVTNLSTSKLCSCNSDPLLEELNQLVKTNGMELVIGDKFPVINPYGSYGCPYVFDFLFQQLPSSDNPIKYSVLFLCRKEDYIGEFDATLNLVKNYRYFLVFAIKMKNEAKFKIKDIIPDAGLMGMSLYYGHLDMDLSQFQYIDDKKNSGPKNVRVDFINGCVPIIISSESSTQILYYYQGRWLEYVERDI